MSRLKLCVYSPRLKGFNASLFSCDKTLQLTGLLLGTETNEEHVYFKAVLGLGFYKGICASHLSSVHTDVTLCLFLSSTQCRFCCVPSLDNAQHILRRQPVGTWRCNTLPSCTGLLISLLFFFSFFVRKHCIAIFHHHASLWL